MTKRRPISKRVRFEVFKRDAFTCQYCGAHPPAVVLHVDHITAVARGGANDPDNLITACESCNQGKGARDLKVAPESLSDKAARVAEAEDQLAGYTAIMRARQERIEADCWEVVAALFGEGESIRRDWFASVRRFVEQLGVVQVVEAAELARARTLYRSDSKQFAYFCGICWNWIRGSRYGED